MITKSTPNLEYVLVLPKDIDTYLQLDQLFARPPWYALTTDRAKALREILRDKLFFVLEDSVPVGLAAYRIGPNNEAMLHRIAVISSRRRNGIGRAATKFLLEIVKDCPRICLIVHQNNPAKDLYKSLGFEIEKADPDYFGDGEPRFLMVYRK